MATRSKKRAGSRNVETDTYHHGNLRRALLDTACQIIEETGLQSVTMRELARRVGVSPGAPFRHFPTRAALLTGIAEEATVRLRDGVLKAVAECSSDDPLLVFRAMGQAYIAWVLENPTYFQIVSTRRLIDWKSSKTLDRDNNLMRAEMRRLLDEAQHKRLLRSQQPEDVELAARALVYGLGRMYADGHFAQWLPPARNRKEAMESVLDLFIAGLRQP